MAELLRIAQIRDQGHVQTIRPCLKVTDGDATIDLMKHKDICPRASDQFIARRATDQHIVPCTATQRCRPVAARQNIVPRGAC